MIAPPRRIGLQAAERLDAALAAVAGGTRPADIEPDYGTDNAELTALAMRLCRGGLPSTPTISRRGLCKLEQRLDEAFIMHKRTPTPSTRREQASPAGSRRHRQNHGVLWRIPQLGIAATVALALAASTLAARPGGLLAEPTHTPTVHAAEATPSPEGTNAAQAVNNDAAAEWRDATAVTLSGAPAGAAAWSDTAAAAATSTPGDAAVEPAGNAPVLVAAVLAARPLQTPPGVLARASQQ